MESLKYSRQRLPGPQSDRDAERAACSPRRRAGKRSRLFSRRNAERLNRDEIIQRAQLLPRTDRAIVMAYYDLGMSVPEIAALHNVAVRQMRYKVEHLYDLLCDPSFVLAARFSEHLPYALARIARDYWIEGQTFRQLTALHHTTLHQIRSQIKLARSLLVIAMAGQQAISPELACRVLD